MQFQPKNKLTPKAFANFSRTFNCISTSKKGGVLFSLRNLCVPLRLCGKQVVRAHLPERRRGTQRHAEKKFESDTTAGSLILTFNSAVAVIQLHPINWRAAAFGGALSDIRGVSLRLE